MVMSRHAQLVFERQRALIRRLDEAITPATVRFHAVTLAAGMWIAALAMVSTAGAFDRHGTLKGVDFLQFYTAARMAADGRVHQLYDWAAFASTLNSFMPTRARSVTQRTRCRLARTATSSTSISR